MLTGFTVIASVTGTSGTDESIFKSVWTVFILAAFVAIQIICIFTLKPKFTLYRAGFYLLHIGLVLFLIGSFVYYISGDKINVSVPVDESTTYNQVKREEADENGSTIVKLGFDMGIMDFKVERYTDDDGNETSDKYYEAALTVSPEGTREYKNIKLTVNHPYRTSGWKIYLTGYDQMNESTVNLMLKKDPGEFVALAGIWMTMAGAVVMCLLKKREAGGTK